MRTTVTLRSPLIIASILLTSTAAHARAVEVKYAGVIELSALQCTTITRSSFIRELCFDSHHDEVIVQLSSAWYRYCKMEDTTVNAWLSAPSMGKYYNRHVKGKKTC